MAPARTRAELRESILSQVITGGATDGKTGAMNIVAPPDCKTWLANPARALREPKAASSMNSVECRSSEVEMTGKRRNATHTSKPALRMVTQRSLRCAVACRNHWQRANAKIRPHKTLSASSTAQILTPASKASHATIIAPRALASLLLRVPWNRSIEASIYGRVAHFLVIAYPKASDGGPFCLFA